ncbi:transcriptional regulator [Pseudomonas cichorii]|uniref:AraC family transcriptional regulator n=1 Tax=Pseudomonas serbiensis TaxID=3064350 RepID=A0ABT9CJL8_9PSED|nr:MULTISPECIES: AraC family transcriptional regulator [Pseudomonas]MDO7925680.1 AraC family transcriptional regulator [Pseudomonas sp. KFB-138]GFM88538.1 transcriptional regulator [Pseudomonas cichorii]
MNLQTHVRSEDPFQGIHAACNDAQSAQAWMANICGPHGLKVSAPQRLNFQHAGNVLKSMSTVIGCIEYGTDVTIDIDASALCSYSISLPLNGQQALRRPEGLLLSDSLTGLIVSPHAQQELSIAGDCRKIQVAIKCAAMRQVLEEMLQRSVDAPVVFDAQISTHDGSTAAWWRWVKHLLAEMEQSRDFFAHLSMVRDIERALIKGLLLSQPNNYSCELLSLSQARCPEYLSRAKQFIHQHADEGITLEDIEHAAGISRFKLSSDFKKHFGISPLCYLKRYRLEAVRRALLEEGCNQNISAVAMRWGFNHLGRFSSDYKKLFLEMPSTTVERRRLY